MKRLFKSKTAQAVALIIGYFASVNFVRSINWQYDAYVSLFLGGSGGSEFVFIISAMFLIASSLFLIFSVKSSTNYSEGRLLRTLRKADLPLLLILTYCVVVLCVFIASTEIRNVYLSTTWGNPTQRDWSALLLLFLSAIAYGAVMALLIEITARIRHKRIRQTIYWPRFFEQFPLNRPAGFLMALLLGGNLVYLLIIFPITVQWNQISVLIYIFSGLTLVALTYFCTFVLSLSAEYERSNAEKIQAERLKTELITNVSHDIRTPLTSIINYVDLLKALPIEDDEFINYVGVLDKKSSRLKTLIDDLMEASKAGTGNLSVTLEALDLAEIVGQVAGDFDERFVERHLVLVFPQPEQPVTARADSRHLCRVLENLFKNISKYALQGTRVFVEVATRGSMPIITLRNTSQDPIFLPSDALTEQFIRGDRARQTEGNGLGLYIAKGLMESMGGGLSIRTIGDLFEVTLWFG